MKRLAVAGLFASIGGAAGLLLLVSIVQSCGHGGQPHDMGTDAHTNDNNRQMSAVVNAPATHSLADAPSTKKLTIPRG